MKTTTTTTPTLCIRGDRRAAEIRSPKHGALCGPCAVREVEALAERTGVMDVRAAMGWGPEPR